MNKVMPVVDMDKVTTHLEEDMVKVEDMVKEALAMVVVADTIKDIKVEDIKAEEVVVVDMVEVVEVVDIIAISQVIKVAVDMVKGDMAKAVDMDKVVVDIIAIFQDIIAISQDIKVAVVVVEVIVVVVAMVEVVLVDQRQMHWVFMVMNVLMLAWSNNYIILVMDKQLVSILTSMMIFLLKRVQDALNLTMNSLKRLLEHSFYITFI